MRVCGRRCPCPRRQSRRAWRSRCTRKRVTSDTAAWSRRQLRRRASLRPWKMTKLGSSRRRPRRSCATRRQLRRSRTICSTKFSRWKRSLWRSRQRAKWPSAGPLPSACSSTHRTSPSKAICCHTRPTVSASCRCSSRGGCRGTSCARCRSCRRCATTSMPTALSPLRLRTGARPSTASTPECATWS